MICYVPGYGRKRDDINIQRQVVWIAKALNAPRYRVFVVMMREKISMGADVIFLSIPWGYY
uniref:Uncharacterized protein n=1 Tax=Candidatus Kentrum sp. TC TaxID=2126339 RepID=A0A450YZL1_9GAMM|nr:MAG: hypothetical protein BECKTC1821E_GA0114239_10742 [Candidatus Kentron sp. TC]